MKPMLSFMAMLCLAIIVIPSYSYGKTPTPPSCTGFKTYTQGGWGAKANGNNAGVYRDANFAAAFPSGLVMGCTGGNQLILTSAQAVEDFLPSGSTPDVLPSGTLTNPGGSYSNVLAGQLEAAMLNVGFDLYDPNFSSNAIHTGDLTITSGTFAGMTINQLIAEANSVIGGCTSTYTTADLNVALTAFNENYDNGTTDNGYTNCTPTCNIAIDGSKNNITCHDASNGSINITVTGNNGAVTYLWNDGITTEDRTGLPAGSYSVTATDAAGCHITSETFTINEPDALGISGTPLDVTTVGGSDGSIDVTVSGGTTNYTYLWNDGVTTEDRSGLPAGNYSVTVTDHNGCTIGKSFIIHEPTCNIAIDGSKNDITCNGSSNGSIDITVTGSNGSVTYLWNDNATSEDRTGLSAGSYSVTATDAAGCHITSETFTIAEPDALGISGTPLDVTTVGGSDGSIDVTVTGGTTNYTYLWNDGETTEDRTGLPAGNYSVTVTDHNGCTIGKSFIIHEPTCNIAISGAVTKVTCFGGNNGAINVTVTGNSGAVSYLWNDNVTTEDRSNLVAGTYFVKATDAAGCSVTSSNFTVTQGKKIKITATVTPQTTKNACDGTASLSATGGTAPYVFTWNDGYVGATRTGLCMGTYTITVTDKKGCPATCKVKIACSPAIAQSTNGQESITAGTTSFSVAVSPNPTKGLIRVSVNAVTAGNATINVYDLTGRILISNKINVVKGTNMLELNLEKLAKGLYQVQIAADNNSKTFKIILE